MRTALVTDAWFPQINGVVRTLDQTARHLQEMGDEVLVVSSAGQPAIACPTYPEIPLVLHPYRHVRRMFQEFRPDTIHIATEGPLGLAARFWCRRQGARFTTSLHTRFPEYVSARYPIPLSWGYAFLRWFHAGATRTMVSSLSLASELQQRGIRNLAVWGRGVDTELFRPIPDSERLAMLPGPRPAFVYFGRVAVEKNVEDFLRLPLPGRKHVIGDGPQGAELRRRYPDANWLGMMEGIRLSRHLASADVMVFPSRTDTLGLVVLEANACGVPVAAYPVTGPLATIENGRNGVMDRDLGHASLEALQISRPACRAAALACGWEKCTEVFRSHLTPAFPSAGT